MPPINQDVGLIHLDRRQHVQILRIRLHGGMIGEGPGVQILPVHHRGKTLQTAQQEMVLTLPNRLMNAFHEKVHERDIDPDTGKPFTSFYRWLWLMPPKGCGLSGSHYMDIEDILHQLRKSRERQPEEHRGSVDALITDLVKGSGAKKPPGPKEKHAERNPISTNGILQLPRRTTHVRSADTLAVRLVVFPGIHPHLL
jgi:hypothetical protein